MNLFFQESLGRQFYVHITIHLDLAGQGVDAVHIDDAFPAGSVAAAGGVGCRTVFPEQIQKVVALFSGQPAILG